ncbi:unnamed protein product [Cyprideis torosa]|uniref:Adenylosuccinate synthetase n=1 Tax=Cyprideis torosa TaxID=163714 RepID=A0A7R8W793_9CRUS|nr:unnamed protein product [Cyprideis torosa]CAG0882948.1 unnamed protein product [Cyprideis torosa]
MISNTGSLAGKVIFITGASRGIGKAIALKAAKDGAKIVVAAKTSTPHPKLPGTIFTAAEERTQQTEMKRYDLMNNINTRGTFLVSKTAIPHLLNSKNPHILNISPPLNMNPRWFRDNVAYTIAKYGMSMCALGMAEEFKGKIAKHLRVLRKDPFLLSPPPVYLAHCRASLLLPSRSRQTNEQQTGHPLLPCPPPPPGHPLMPDFYLDEYDEWQAKMAQKLITPERGTAAGDTPPSSDGQVDAIFNQIRNILNEDIIQKTGATYVFEIKGKEQGTWYVDLKTPPGVVEAGPGPGSPDVTFTMDTGDFVKMFAGKMKPTTAFMMGKLKIKGDTQKALKLEKVMNNVRSAKMITFQFSSSLALRQRTEDGWKLMNKGLQLRNLSTTSQAPSEMNSAPSVEDSPSPCSPGRDSVTVVIGSQWGDEGKGKLVDILSGEVDVVCRCQGGNNAGHTVQAEGVTHDFHLLPSGVVRQGCMSVIGNGVVLNVHSLFEEIETAEKRGCTGIRDRLIVSDRAHLTFGLHMMADGYQENDEKLGTTRKGIGPSYSNKAARLGLRVTDLVNEGNWKSFEEKFRRLAEYWMRVCPGLDYDVENELVLLSSYASLLRPMVEDTVVYLNNCLRQRKRILIEGANATMLDLDFGTYPYVTSSNCSVGGVCTGLGIPPCVIKDVIGVMKAYTTRVGAGPFPTECKDDVGDRLQRIGGEVGTTTGRRRRCGWLDLVVVRYASMINGFTAMNLTKLDVLDDFDEVKIGKSYSLNGQPVEGFPSNLNDLARVQVEYITLKGWKKSIRGVTSFDDLPQAAKDYILKIEELLGVQVKWIGTGKDRRNIVVKP